MGDINLVKSSAWLPLCEQHCNAMHWWPLYHLGVLKLLLLLLLLLVMVMIIIMIMKKYSKIVMMMMKYI